MFAVFSRMSHLHPYLKRPAGESQRSRKRRCVEQVLGLGIPMAKISKLVHRLQECPEILEFGIHEKTLGRAIHAELDAVVESTLMPRDPDERGNPREDFLWQYCTFGKLLSEFAAACPEFARALRSLGQTSPQRPLHLVVYFDETVPGNALRLDVPKKFMVVYCTFRELGHFLKHEAMWLPIVVCEHQY